MCIWINIISLDALNKCLKAQGPFKETPGFKALPNVAVTSQEILATLLHFKLPLNSKGYV